MEYISTVAMIVGGIMWVVGTVWFLGIAFRANPALGLACMFIPFFELIFVFKNSRDTWQPFLILLGGRFLLFTALCSLPAPHRNF